MELEEILERLPLSALVKVAKDSGLDAGMAHSREDLTRAIVIGESLPANPLVEVRKRIHKFVSCHWDSLERAMDPICADCHRNGQNKCWDVRALGDYILNLPLIEIEEQS